MTSLSEAGRGSRWTGRARAGILGVVLASCSSDGGGPSAEPHCLSEPADATCKTALYGLQADGTIAPTFDEVFSNTLEPVCGASGCHSGDHPQAGLKLDDIDTAYQGLLATNARGEVRVKPGDVKCGKVIVRLETEGESWSMPPSNHLPEPTLCAIRHWIANGAKR